MDQRDPPAREQPGYIPQNKATRTLALRIRCSERHRPIHNILQLQGGRRSPQKARISVHSQNKLLSACPRVRKLFVESDCQDAMRARVRLTGWLWNSSNSTADVSRRSGDEAPTAPGSRIDIRRSLDPCKLEPFTCLGPRARPPYLTYPPYHHRPAIWRLQLFDLETAGVGLASPV